MMMLGVVGPAPVGLLGSHTPVWAQSDTRSSVTFANLSESDMVELSIDGESFDEDLDAGASITISLDAGRHLIGLDGEDVPVDIDEGAQTVTIHPDPMGELTATAFANPEVPDGDSGCLQVRHVGEASGLQVDFDDSDMRQVSNGRAFVVEPDPGPIKMNVREVASQDAVLSDISIMVPEDRCTIAYLTTDSDGDVGVSMRIGDSTPPVAATADAADLANLADAGVAENASAGTNDLTRMSVRIAKVTPLSVINGLDEPIQVWLGDVEVGELAARASSNRLSIGAGSRLSVRSTITRETANILDGEWVGDEQVVVHRDDSGDLQISSWLEVDDDEVPEDGCIVVRNTSEYETVELLVDGASMDDDIGSGNSSDAIEVPAGPSEVVVVEPGANEPLANLADYDISGTDCSTLALVGSGTPNEPTALLDLGSVPTVVLAPADVVSEFGEPFDELPYTGSAAVTAAIISFGILLAGVGAQLLMESRQRQGIPATVVTVGGLTLVRRSGRR